MQRIDQPSRALLNLLYVILAVLAMALSSCLFCITYSHCKDNIERYLPEARRVLLNHIEMDLTMSDGDFPDMFDDSFVNTITHREGTTDTTSLGDDGDYIPMARRGRFRQLEEMIFDEQEPYRCLEMVLEESEDDDEGECPLYPNVIVNKF